MADCEHGYPSPASCARPCTPRVMPDPPKLVREGWPFTAQFDGTCGGCDSGTEVGQRIVRMSDGSYRHLGQCEKVRHRG